jgi:hypothetical protein
VGYFLITMNIWIILSWVFVLLLTAVNIFIFLKLKGVSQQMMQMAFPGTKDMNEAVAKMQSMMGSMGQMQNRPGFRGPGVGGGGGGKNVDPQLKAALDMLQKIQTGKK